jgi:hypothetical protein
MNEQPLLLGIDQVWRHRKTGRLVTVTATMSGGLMQFVDDTGHESLNIKRQWFVEQFVKETSHA